jgi:hypothetical protein
MIVSTLKELSKWGTTMGATLLGFWTFTLCSFPYAIATGGLVLKVGLAGVAAVPLLIMRCEKRHLFWEFSLGYVCPEPVLAK